MGIHEKHQDYDQSGDFMKIHWNDENHETSLEFRRIMRIIGTVRIHKDQYRTHGNSLE